jgi:hypothetical protein
MPIDKSHIRKGAYLTGGNFAAVPVIKHAPLPADLEEFEAAAAEADRLATSGLDEIRQRLDKAREQLEELRAAVRRT